MRRSLALLADFRVEQVDPGRFYRALAADSVRQLCAFTELSHRTVLDVGGGPDYFRPAFERAGARYVAVDVDRAQFSPQARGAVVADASALPVRCGAVDVCYSSNMLEHVPDPERAADEMVRVTRPGGLVLISYTTWYSPWGGHETSPWHYLGGSRAARIYRHRHGAPARNEYGRSLFPVTAGRMLRWARSAERRGQAVVVAAFPRYHPAWAFWLVGVPGLRELALWNLVIVVRRT